jgi:hypothetical protein
LASASRPRQPVIDRHAQDRGWFLRCSPSIGGRCRQAQIGISNQFRSAPAGPFGQVTFALGLQAPSDAFDQPDFVVRRRRLAADLSKLDA